MKLYCTFLLCFITLFLGCSVPMHHKASSVNKFQYQEEIVTSLFESDKNEISQDAVDRLLSGKIKFSDKTRIAVYKMPSSYSLTHKYYGYSSEERLDTEQEIFQSVSSGISNTKKILWVKPLPSILSPSKTTISKLREAAVRLQADLLVIFSVSSDIFNDYNVFSQNEVKAYSTCEMIAFDTRTGIIPFSEVKTKKIVEIELPSDANINETRKRAEKKAIIKSLKDLSSNLKNMLENSE